MTPTATLDECPSGAHRWTWHDTAGVFVCTRCGAVDEAN